MGITIHYKTAFRGCKTALLKKLNELADFARVLGFKEAGPIYEVDFKNDFNTADKHTPMVKDKETGKMEIDGSYRWAKIQAQPNAPMPWYEDDAKTTRSKEKVVKRVKENMHRYNGFVLSLWWGDGCEATNLCFIRIGKGMVWDGGSFTKTQYASEFVKAHATVCTLLKAAVRVGLVTEVSDEGDYYEGEDITQLADANEESLKGIASLAEMLKKQFGVESIGGNGLEAEERLKEFPDNSL